MPSFRNTVSGVAGKAKGFALFAANKTKKVSRIAKLNIEITSRRETIKRAYSEIGKLYYESHKDAPEGFFIQLCQEIDVSMEAIAAMEAEIARLKMTDEEPEASDDGAAIEVEITEEPEAPAEAEVSEAEAAAEPEAPADAE